MATMKRVTLVLVAVMSCVLMQSASALIHVVGGESGWEIPPNTTFYCDWARPQVFGVGDKLVFPYRTGAHNVLQVSKEDFDKCGNDNIINQFYMGPTIIQLNATGDYYFYSGVGTHCELGQKLHITVVPGPGKSGFHLPQPRRLLSLDGPAPAPLATKNAATATATTAHAMGLVISSFLVAMLLI